MLLAAAVLYGASVAAATSTTGSAALAGDLTRYPGYTGDLAPTGLVEASFEGQGKDAAVTFTYDLAGVDPECATLGPDPAVANSCGIHFHAGTSCDEASQVGGHYFQDQKVDPWTYGAPYTTAKGSTHVRYGFNAEETVGRVFVLHARNGGRISCDIVPGLQAPVASATIRGDLAAYPEYAGDSKVSGKVDITYYNNGAASFAYDLAGFDPLCDQYGPDPTVGNSCGIHFHAGTCDTDADGKALAGGHYWNSAALLSDPWTFGATFDGARGSTKVFFGEESTSAVGRAFVLHDRNGKRATCTTVPPLDVKARFVSLGDYTAYPGTTGVNAEARTGLGEFPAYPGYVGDLSVSGSVAMKWTSEDTVEYTWKLSGLDDRCLNDGPVATTANSCGIHFHSGTSCDEASLVGGHYYDSATITADPWTYGAFYASAEGSTSVTYGFDAASTVGRAFVLHDQDGARIACQVVPALHSGVRGSVTADFVSDNTVVFNYDLTGLDAGCADGPAEGVANSCGLHIHSGTSCAEASLVGGHYWNPSASLPADPWTFGAPYQGSTGSLQVTSGYGAQDVVGRAFVLHNKLGQRLSCDIIQAPETSTGKSIIAGELDSYPGYTGPLKVTASVELNFLSSGAVDFTYVLTGADDDCATLGPDAGVPNSCGLHIHSGDSCDDASLVGGHWWDSFALDVDPWTFGAPYTAASGKPGTLRVVNGKQGTDSTGKTFVLHDRTGARISCVLVPKPELCTGAASIDEFSAYPGTSGTAEGVVDITFGSGGTVDFAYSLADVDPTCAYGPDPAVPNSCGIHFHAGTSCDDADLVGGHYWSGSPALPADPWTFGSPYTPDAEAKRGRRSKKSYKDKKEEWDNKDDDYTSDKDDSDKDDSEPTQAQRVIYRLDAESTVGRAFVLHNRDGSRRTCNIVPALKSVATTAIDKFPAYPGYAGDLSVSGFVGIQWTSDNTVKFNWKLSGLDERCLTDGPVATTANSCGIHFHSGTCDTDADGKALAGGHYWNSAALDADPWTYGAFYDSAMGSTSVTNGQDAASTVGRAFVLHNQDGARISCQVVPPLDVEMASNKITEFNRYPGYTGKLRPWGRVDMKWSAGSVLFKYILYGADKDCDKKGPKSGVANSCGIHFHSGTSCADASLVGGHYWNSAELAADPWTYGATYTQRGYEKVFYGAGSGSTTGRVFVLHDRDGKRISCDVVGAGNARTVEQRVVQASDYEDVVVPDWVAQLWDVPAELDAAGALFPSLAAMMLASALALF